MAEQVPCWLEIDHRAILHNLQFFRKNLPPTTKLFSVIKSNAYGHGFLAIGKTMQSSPDVSGVVVNTIDEGILLRNNNFQKRIIVTGAYRTPNLIVAAQQQKLEVEIINQEALTVLQYLDSQASPLMVHVKVNTGLNRLGFDEYDTSTAIATLKQNPMVRIQGLFSHFANSEDPQSLQTISQITTFKQFIANYPGLENHISASAATLLIPETHFDLVRVGISSYGLWPSKQVEALWHKYHPEHPESPFQRALSFRSVVVHIATIDIGESVGYGGTFITSRPTRMAIIPCGYYEGLPRLWCNRAHFLVCGKKAPIIGRIAMNMTTIDITDIPEANQNSIVTIIGQDGDEIVTAEDQAFWADTINYELLTRLPDFIVRKHL